VVATVGPGVAGGPAWYELASAGAMLATIAFTALVTAGLVDRAVSSRPVAVVGRRVLPRSGHVVVVGLGQVGVRLCLRLRGMNVPVVAVERDPLGTNLRLARDNGIPVLIGDASERRMLDRLRLDAARALACMGSDDLDNVEVAVAARAVSPEVRVVLRAGEHPAIAETRSLFHVGAVCDIVAFTALAVVHLVRFGSEPRVRAHPAGVEVACAAGHRVLPPPSRCACRPASAG
jgi:voltage-gated potassium channel Kch